MKRMLALALLSACTDNSTPEIPEVRSTITRELQPSVSPTDYSTLVTGNTQFAADLYAAVKDEPGNLFMSPHSISIALAMTYAGANTKTASQMAETLHFDLPAAQLHASFNKLDLELASRAASASGNTIPFRLTTANSIFGQKDKMFEQPFLDALAHNYGAGLRVLDFATDPESARLTINDWVEDRTNDKITDLLPLGSINPDTRLVLTNAIYFSAAWHEPFLASETADRPFKLASEAISVPTLHQVAERGYGAGEGYRAAELPYDGGKLSMVVVVPDDLATFEASLDAPRITSIMASLRESMLDLTLPKFKFDAPLGLKDVLSDLGMVDAFTPGAADFSGIDGTRNLVITDVLHKGFIAIDEKGTEAAAATAVIVGETSAPEPATLAVDKPFVFFIRDIPTGAILFVGRVVDPRS